MMALLLLEIVALPAESSRGRHHPRVVKRKMSNFPTKARAAPASSAPLRYARHIRIVAPAAPAAIARLAMPKTSPKPASRRRAKTTPDRGCRLFWLEHLRAWRASNLPRAAYCRRHRLQPRTFNAWVARLRHRFRRQPTSAKTP